MPTIPNWLFYIVTLLVLGLWSAGIVISFISSTFQMPETLNGAVPLVLVGVYSVKAVSDRRGEDDDNE
jgi:hypothetical protein